MAYHLATMPPQLPRPRDHRPAGFTLVEMLAVIAVMAILATIALPSFLDRIMRKQVDEGLAVADFVRQAVATSYAVAHTLPADNTAAGLPSSDKIVGNYVADVAVKDGAVTITFGNKANGSLNGKKLTLRPAVVTDAPMVPIAWVCGNAAVPAKMTAMGSNDTTLPLAALPMTCRG
jgi:type IV pilus assembly protein PilA